MFLHLVFTAIFCLCSRTAHANTTEEATALAKKWDATHANLIWGINKSSINQERQRWSSWTLEEYALQLWEHAKKPTAYNKREAAFDVFKSHQAERTDGVAQKDNEQLWQDLSLFCGQKNSDVYTAKAAIPTLTELGIVNTCMVLSTPTTDTTAIGHRQSFIKAIIENPDLQNSLENELLTFAQHEHILLQFWDEREHFATDLHKMVYFDKNGMFKKLNDSALAMQLSGVSAIGTHCISTTLQSLAACILGVYGAAKLCNIDVPAWLQNGADYRAGAGGLIAHQAFDFFDNNQLHGAIALGIAGYCGYRASESIQHLRGLLLYIATYSKIIHHVGRSLRALHNLIQQLEKHNLMDNPACALLKTTYAKPEIKALFAQANSSLFDITQDESMNFFYAGRLFAFLQKFFQAKQSVESSMIGLAEVDTLAACAKNITQQPERWCFAEFVTGAHPYIIAKGFWHPIIGEKAITNSITLGCDGYRPHIIITGPNAGGKSTTMKALVTDILFCQTLGICPAQSFTMTPFKHIKTHLNIRDDIGAGNSLFMAEAKRALELLAMIKNAPTGEFIACFFDEMFNSTTPIEGCASALSLAEELEMYNNCICLIATHFAELTELEKTTAVFTNMNVSVAQDVDGKLLYPFTMQPGISNEHVALKILRNEGFSGSFIDRAEKAVYRLAPPAA
jgi:DNA mismatch repair protein MutS